MKCKKILIFLAGLLLFACVDKNTGILMEIPVDTNQNTSLPLSLITENIKAIELELTDESMINPDHIIQILLTDSNVIIAGNKSRNFNSSQILVFTIDGKFSHSIGGRGQSPGEFTYVSHLAIDEKSKHLFVSSREKIICYDLDGKFLKYSSLFSTNTPPVKDMNFINNELLIVVEHAPRKDSKGVFQHSAVYKLNDDLQVIDSCTIRDTYFERAGMYIHPYENFLLFGNGNTYLYYSDIYFNQQNPFENVLRDTLYCLKNNHLIPELKLKFNNDGIDGSGNKFIWLYNIYRSSRFVFAFYLNERSNNLNHFCYDIETGTGYNMQEGYTDDINKIDRRIKILPLITNTEMFYYWHTHIKPDDPEEPNPTLYIGTLKK